MPVVITAAGADENVLEQVLQDAGLSYVLAGNVHEAVEAVAADFDVIIVPSADRNMIEQLADALAVSSFVCPVALAPYPPFLVPDIAGWLVSKTTTTAEGGNEQYLAIAPPTPMWPIGWRFIEGVTTTRTVTEPLGQASIVIATDAGRELVAGWCGDGLGWVFRLQENSVIIHEVYVPGVITDVPALGVDAITRNVAAYLNGVQVTGGAFAPGGAAEGWLTGPQVAIGAALAFQSNGTLDMRLVKDAADMAHTYPGATWTWCGEQVGA